MNRRIANLLAWLDLSEAETWAMGTRNPAKLLGLDQKVRSASVPMPTSCFGTRSPADPRAGIPGWRGVAFTKVDQRRISGGMTHGYFRLCAVNTIPFRDMDVIRRVRQIRREDITRHPNPDFRIQVVPDADMEFNWLADMFHRIKTAADQRQRLVMITPNPWPSYAKIAKLINMFRVDCRNLWTFNMDEYANEHGQTPPESWEFGFMHAFKKYFWQNIDPSLRPPEHQVLGPTTANINDYGKMLADVGGADICYCGPGWSGHLAFIEPDCAGVCRHFGRVEADGAADLHRWVC